MAARTLNPADQPLLRAHYVKAKVKLRKYPDGSYAVFHGPRCLARYDAEGRIEGDIDKAAA